MNFIHVLPSSELRRVVSWTYKKLFDAWPFWEMDPCSVLECVWSDRKGEVVADLDEATSEEAEARGWSIAFYPHQGYEQGKEDFKLTDVYGNIRRVRVEVRAEVGDFTGVTAHWDEQHGLLHVVMSFEIWSLEELGVYLNRNARKDVRADFYKQLWEMLGEALGEALGPKPWTFQPGAWSAPPGRGINS